MPAFDTPPPTPPCVELRHRLAGLGRRGENTVVLLVVLPPDGGCWGRRCIANPGEGSLFLGPATTNYYCTVASGEMAACWSALPLAVPSSLLCGGGSSPPSPALKSPLTAAAVGGKLATPSRQQ